MLRLRLDTQLRMVSGRKECPPTSRREYRFLTGIGVAPMLRRRIRGNLLLVEASLQTILTYESNHRGGS